jgi:peroxin-7
MRQLSLPIVVLNGHTQSIKQVKFDPHSRTHIASSSYDFTVRIWDYSDPLVPLKQTTDHHTEFTYSVDFSIHRVGLIADCSWDKTVKVYIPAYLST